MFVHWEGLLTSLEKWEIARVNKVRHFVWSNLDYALRLGVRI